MALKKMSNLKINNVQQDRHNDGEKSYLHTANYKKLSK